VAISEEPEIDVRRDAIQDGPARWVVVIHSASVREEVELDPNVQAAIGPAIILHLFTVMDDLTRSHPEVMRDVDLAGMMVQLLARVRECSSFGGPEGHPWDRDKAR
jgi:hypothetical protein